MELIFQVCLTFVDHCANKLFSSAFFNFLQLPGLVAWVREVPWSSLFADNQIRNYPTNEETPSPRGHNSRGVPGNCANQFGFRDGDIHWNLLHWSWRAWRGQLNEREFRRERGKGRKEVWHSPSRRKVRSAKGSQKCASYDLLEKHFYSNLGETYTSNLDDNVICRVLHRIVFTKVGPTPSTVR